MKCIIYRVVNNDLSFYDCFEFSAFHIDALKHMITFVSNFMFSYSYVSIDCNDNLLTLIIR